MSNNCTIAYEFEDGRIALIRCYENGKIEQAGKALVKNYYDEEDIQDLIVGGDVDCFNGSFESLNPIRSNPPMMFEDGLDQYIDTIDEISDIFDIHYIFRDGRWGCFIEPNNCIDVEDDLLDA